MVTSSHSIALQFAQGPLSNTNSGLLIKTVAIMSDISNPELFIISDGLQSIHLSLGLWEDELTNLRARTVRHGMYETWN